MNYSKFILYNVVGAIVWCGLFIYGGYFFGNLSFVKNNFSLVIIVIILISILPMVFEYAKHRLYQKKTESDNI